MKQHFFHFCFFLGMLFLFSLGSQTFISAIVSDPTPEHVLQCFKTITDGPATFKEKHSNQACGKEGEDGKEHCKDEGGSSIIKQCTIAYVECRVDGELKEWCLPYATPEEKPFCSDHTLYRVDEPPVSYKEHGCTVSCKKECRPMLLKPIKFPLPKK